MITNPSVGDAVHFVEPVSGAHFAAVITKVNEDGGVADAIDLVDLTVFEPGQIRFETDVPYDLVGEGRTWHWPERTGIESALGA